MSRQGWAGGPYGSALAATAVKRITMPISGAGSNGTTTAVTDANQRAAVLLPCTTTRWRLRIKNESHTNGVQAGAITFTDVYVGTPNIQTTGGLVGQWLGDFTAAPAMAITAADGVSGGVTGPSTTAAGDEWVSPWVTDAALQFQADTLSAISYGFTCASGQSLILSASYQTGLFFGAGASAAAGAQSPAAVSSGGFPNSGGQNEVLDVRLEYETDTDLPVVLVIGDSLVEGYIEDSNYWPYIIGPHVPWPGQMGLHKRMLVINGGIGSQTMASFTNASDWAYERFDLTTTVPDVALVSLGGNDALGGVTPQTYFTNLASVISTLKGLGVKRVLGVIPPWVPVPAQMGSGELTSGVAAQATSIETSVSYASGAVIWLDPGTDNSESVTASAASTGNGPYTTTVSATANAHDIHAQCGLGAFNLLSQYIQGMRSGACGLDGIVDLEGMLGGAQTSFMQWWGKNASTGIHPSAAAYARIGSLIDLRI